MEMKKRIAHMRRGVIDQILMMLLVFVFLVTMFFLIVDYSSIGKIQNQLDMLTREGSRLVSLGKDKEKIANLVNMMRTNYYAPITTDDIACNVDSTKTTNKVTFIVSAPFYSKFEALGSDGNMVITSTSLSYNEFSSSEVNCTVTLAREGT